GPGSRSAAETSTTATPQTKWKGKAPLAKTTSTPNDANAKNPSAPRASRRLKPTEKSRAAATAGTAKPPAATRASAHQVSGRDEKATPEPSNIRVKLLKRPPMRAAATPCPASWA